MIINGSLTFGNGDDAVLGKSRLIVVDIDHANTESGRSRQLWVPLIRRDDR